MLFKSIPNLENVQCKTEICSRSGEPPQMPVQEEVSVFFLVEKRFQQPEFRYPHQGETPFYQAFLIFIPWFGIPGDTAAEPEFPGSLLTVSQHGPYGHAEDRFPSGREIADAAGVDIARGVLQLRDNLHGTPLGRPG